jgi:hypothetical protein
LDIWTLGYSPFLTHPYPDISRLPPFRTGMRMFTAFQNAPGHLN